MILEKVVADKNVKRRKNAKNALIILRQSEKYNASACIVCRKELLKLDRGGSCAVLTPSSTLQYNKLV